MDSKLQSLKSQMKREFARTPGVEGFGVGHDHLRVYVRNREVSKLLPATYRGVPVEQIVAGEIEAQELEPIEAPVRR